ncbi:transaldolase family protein [[Limnothrix rosea] IAM M-220]|uniref:transaldolase family protein n=1 Tax=[Limnothrix rosea] IAM M-220 TaxID=454133 RepID=UPI00095C74B5|nr:transaldolase family protein [[Limnothrix rosea] IAM M-220]OKH17761.1 transaldolase [[Limnothrix rosea] IAM M-220]
MIYLDSAIATEASQAMAWGWVKGITTNPTLLAKSDTEPAATLKTLANITDGELYYQLVGQTLDDMIREAHKAKDLVGEQLVLKIPATATGFAALPKLSSEITCSVTAIYHPTQALIAAEGGAKYAIAYVNRATRFQGDGCELVSSMKTILQGSETTILAASLKSPAEINAAMVAGADHITVPFGLLQTMTTHSLSEQTVKDFTAIGQGLI